MADNGSGTYTLPQAPFTSGTTISSSAVNGNFSDIATALNNRLTRNGESAASANLPMGGFRHTGVGDASARTHYAAAGQVQDSALVWGGTSTGSANAQEITLAPGISAYAAGQRFAFLAGFTTTAAATLAVSGLEAKSIIGTLAAGQVADVIYDGTNFRTLSNPPPGDNLIINGGFSVNQRTYVTATAKASGVYMHDRWKAGASGCTYTFTQSGGALTTITITAGTLVQAIEGLGIASGSYTLSWTGTATAKLNGGTAAVSPIVATLTAGTNATVEFLTGTVGAVRVEAGTNATPYQPRPAAAELALCQRYYETGVSVLGFGAAGTADQSFFPVHIVPKRALPTASQASSALTNVSSLTVTVASAADLYLTIVATAAGTCAGTSTWTASAEL